MTYLNQLADQIRAAVPPHLVPNNAGELFLLYALLARAKGSKVMPEDVHDAWVAWMQSRGQTHPSMVPFAQLPSPKRDEDDPFVRAIREVSLRETM